MVCLYVSKPRGGADRRAWKTPYSGGVSQSAEDRARSAGLPSVLGDSSYARIAQKLESKAAMRDAVHRRWHGMPPAAPVAPSRARVAGQTRTAARIDEMPSPLAADTRRFANVDAVAKAGFERVAACMYKKGHDIWELRGASDGDDGACVLVRKREERAVDLRQAGGGMAPAVEAGIVRSGRRVTADRREREYARELAAQDPAQGDLDEEPIPVDEAEYGEEAAEQVYDTHEVMHGREPQFDPSAPMVVQMDETVEEAGLGDDLGGLGDEPYDLGPEMGAPELPGDDDLGDEVGPPGGPDVSVASKCAKCADKVCGGAGCGVQARRGMRILAAHDGGVSEGVILEVLDLGDLLADFGLGPEMLAGDMVLEPELELPCPLADDDADDDADADDTEGKSEDESEDEDDEDDDETREKEARRQQARRRAQARARAGRRQVVSVTAADLIR